MAKRTKAQRVQAAKDAWARRKAAAALDAAGVSKFAVVPAEAVKGPALPIAQPVTATVTQDGDNFYLTIYDNGSMHRHKLQATTLRLLALDTLRLVG